jgi:hypothetical protein
MKRWSRVLGQVLGDAQRFLATPRREWAKLVGLTRFGVRVTDEEDEHGPPPSIVRVIALDWRIG